LEGERRPGAGAKTRRLQNWSQDLKKVLAGAGDKCPIQDTGDNPILPIFILLH